MGIVDYKGIIIDTHNDTMMKAVDKYTQKPSVDIGQDTSFQIDINKMEKGKVNIAYFAAFTEDYGTIQSNNHRILASLNALANVEIVNEKRFSVAKNYTQMMAEIERGKRVGVPTIEGAYSIDAENMNGLLKQYADLFVKAIAPVWNHSNALGEGTYSKFASGSDSTGGLTALGVRFIAQMDALNMMVDVSHMNETTFWDVIKYTKRPVIASHSGAASLKPHLRNLNDEQLIAIQKTGGVVNVVFCRYFLGDESAGISNLLDHIEYIVSIIGDEHVGLGSDFDGATMPIGLEDISKVPVIIEGLRDRKFSEKAIENIMGKNNLRLLSAFDKQNDYRVRFNQHTSPVILEDHKTIEWYMDVDCNNLEVENLVFLWDGCELNCTYNEQSKKIVAHSTIEIVERYHVATIEFKDRVGKIYFCTSISELK
ncbi:dipeptidase [Fusibacter bizertensis]